MSYVVGDATRPLGSGPRVIVHVCNDRGGWGAGFVRALSQRWSAPELAYRRWYHSDQPLELGMVQLVLVEGELLVANVIAQRGYANAANPVPLDYEALALALGKLADRLDPRTTVHMPRIGTGLAGGDWSRVERIVDECLGARGLRVTVYDLPRDPGECDKPRSSTR